MSKVRAGGSTQTGRLMNTVNSSSTPKENSSAKPTLIRVTLPNWVIVGEELPISALTAERYGDGWYLSFLLGKSASSRRLVKFPARDIRVNGKSLDHWLEAIATSIT